MHPAIPIASLTGVAVHHGRHIALHGVDLDIPPASLTAIAGHNGAGKSTLLEVLAGIRPPTHGAAMLATRAVAFVPQRSDIPDALPVTVRDVVSVGAWGRRGPWRRPDRAARVAVAGALDRMGIASLARRPISELSGGQRQRALLAQGLARGADLLLLDEPTTGLDAASAARILDAVRVEAARGAAVVCVTHDPRILSAASRVVHLADGRLEPGSPVTDAGRHAATSGIRDG
jgi:zinc/manganese transport system ATP-binding protein